MSGPKYYILERSDPETPYRLVMVSDRGAIPGTGWCKGRSYVEKMAVKAAEQGYDDGGTMIEGSGEGDQRLFDLETSERPLTKDGYDMMEVVSALQKDIRRGNEVEAGFWAFQLAISGYHKYLWRRLSIICVEDVGTASPLTTLIVNSCREMYFWTMDNSKRFDRWNQYLGMAILTMCRANKNREVDTFTWYIQEEVRGLEIPDYAFDGHTRKGRVMGRGNRYFYEVSAQVMPETGVNKYEFIHDKWMNE